MSSLEKRNNPPKNKGPMKINEKPKDLKGSIIKIAGSLNKFKYYILISLILAFIAAILSLVSPNKLSDLTNEITKGITINTDNINILKEELMSNTSKDNITNIINDLLSSSDDTLYNDILVTSSDKLILLSELSNVNEEIDYNFINKLPESIKSIILPDSVIDNVKITTEDKVEVINKLSTMDSINEVYNQLDSLPDNIKKLINPKMNLDIIKRMAIVLVIIYIISVIFDYLQGLLMVKVSNNYARELRRNISLKINKLPLKFFDSSTKGDILSRVTNDIDTMSQSLNQSLATLISSITLFIGSIIMMFITNYIMAITAILSSLIGFIFMFIILGKSQKYFNQRQIELGNLNGYIEEVYSGLNVVKTCNGKDESKVGFDKLNKNVYNCNRKSQFLSGLMGPMMNFISNLGYVMVCVVGALLVNNDLITFGTIVAFIIYVRLFTNPLSQIGQAMTNIQTTAAASERVFEFLEAKEMESEEHITKKLDKDKAEGKIEFKNIKFGYDEDKTIINNFSAVANPGQKIAIVGPTGAGKTTMVNLLMKFYNINSGDILIDGISIKELTRENVHELFTMVLQDTWLFNGTVKENIIYNRKNITDKKVKEICEIVGVDHYIKTLPNGYDSILSDNDSISAGQKQLLTIARAMLSDTPFLILDEATSNVDTRTEELVSKAMDKLIANKTSFIIAHRLSTIKNADLILVMKDGNIIETGNHKELIKKNGFYADLYNSQFENLK